MSITKSESINELATALSKFQGEVSNAHKATKGHGYNYADLASILDLVKEPLAANGLAVVQMPYWDSAPNTVSVSTLVTHSSGQWIESHYSMAIPENKRNSLAQNIGSAITYSRRYALAAALGVAQTDDDASNKGATESAFVLDEMAKQWIAAVKENREAINECKEKNGNEYANFILKEASK